MEQGIPLDTGLLSGAVQRFDTVRNSLAMGCAVVHLSLFGGLFLKAGLNSEILLSIGDFRQLGVDVHRDEVAGVSAKKPICDFSLCSTSDGNHFRCLAKMVIGSLP